MVSRGMGGTVLWSSYPSWRHFSWLYLMAALAAWRALLFWRFGFSGWNAWMAGALALLGTAAVIRRWAHYSLTEDRLIVRNGYTGREIGVLALAQVRDVRIRQGPIASLLGIGTIVVTSNGDEVLRFRGLSNPEAVRQRIQRAVFAHHAVPT